MANEDGPGWAVRRAHPDRPVRNAALGRRAGARGASRTVTGPSQFDVCGPLPSGITLLEASAGTGKTFTIAALAARYVAEGTPLDRMLLVTFGRMATGELRRGAANASSPSRRGCRTQCPRRRTGRWRRGTRAALRGPRRRTGPPTRSYRSCPRRLRRRDDRHDERVPPAGAERHRCGRRRRPGRHLPRGPSDLVDDVVEDLVPAQVLPNQAPPAALSLAVTHARSAARSFGSRRPRSSRTPRRTNWRRPDPGWLAPFATRSSDANGNTASALTYASRPAHPTAGRPARPDGGRTPPGAVRRS